ncbi:DNA gyrase inhibitor YacG [Aeoliella mucimassa]|uniref:DNA gyrase inhibitor YacG n=1 Tax=Aeoliella mucimassa TaxID=2527972 RepID=UPI0021BC9337|nr:DNA gyrase inhibitor YacG [Aeoliella mucimassa]
MVCPTCKKEFDPNDSDSLPFCSERCRLVDLNRWFGEGHGLPSIPDPDADETPEML